MTDDPDKYADVPYVAAWPREDGVEGLRMWCHWCQRWQSHGDGEGHRVAHCNRPDGPYAETGYSLVRAATPAPMFTSMEYGWWETEPMIGSSDRR